MSQTPKPHAPENYRPRVSDILHSASFNKGTAFTERELDEFRLRGLLPPKIESLDQQVARVQAQLHRCNTPLEKYIFLSTLHNRNETLFYRLVLDNLTETLPIIYTPTVGEACVKFSSIWTTTRGMYLALKRDRTQVRAILDNWIHDDVQIIVVTDGSRILGLGDLGVNGMGIPIGKLSLYVAGSGFAPTGTLPIALDTGTNTEKFLNDPEYLGNYTPRIKGEEYLAFLDEFMAAVHDKWPTALVQFEDFSNDTAFLLLDRYRHKYLCFNDDIQGTGAVVCSGFINSLRLAKIRPHDVRIVFYGAGSAGVGVADMIVRYICSQTGVTPEQARTQVWFVDSRGLLTANRGTPFEAHKIPYLRQDNGDRQISDLYEIIEYVRPNALIGLSGIGGSFSDKVITLMGEINDRPIIMALSNPTSNAECTAVQAYTLTKGRAIFASGSPFDPVEYEGKTYITGQGNNMFIFPGLGFGAYLCNASQVSDAMIVASAEVLSQYVSDEQIEAGNIYPLVSEVRKISVLIAARVIAVAKEEGLTSLDLPTDLQSWVESQMYVPHYV